MFWGSTCTKLSVTKEHLQIFIVLLNFFLSKKTDDSKLWEYGWLQVLQEFIRFRCLPSAVFCIYSLFGRFRSRFILAWLLRSDVRLVERRWWYPGQGLNRFFKITIVVLFSCMKFVKYYKSKLIQPSVKTFDMHECVKKMCIIPRKQIL